MKACLKNDCSLKSVKYEKYRAHSFEKSSSIVSVFRDQNENRSFARSGHMIRN